MSNTNDPITYWLNQAGRKPLLPPCQINALAKKIQALPDGHPTRIKLVNKIVEHNLRLVASTVHRFMRGKSNRYWGHEVTLDYLQSGVIGLKRAAEKFKPELGYRFATYATFWIRSFIGRQDYLEMSIVYVPEDAIRAALNAKNNRSTAVNNKFSQVTHNSSFQDVYRAINVDSLDRVVNEDSTVLSRVYKEHTEDLREFPDIFSMDIEELFVRAKIKSDMIDVIRMKYIQNMTNNEIAMATGLSAETVKNRFSGALKKLRQAASSDMMVL